MKELETFRLRENQITNNIYKVDNDFNQLLESIELDGILEPLIVQPMVGTKNEYEVVSGNRRLRAARELSLDKVPVIIQETKPLSISLTIAHQQYRIKNPSEILREILNIKNRYKLKQGARGDLDQNVKKGQEKMNQLIKTHNKSKIDKLTQIDKYIKVLENQQPNIREKELKNLDKSGSIDGTHKRLRKKVEDLKNREKVGKIYEIIRENIKVYQKSSDNLSEIQDNSVASIITSPPYYDIRDYKLGEGELGHEASPKEFVKRLANHFDDSKRVLRKDGTMWLNIGDYVRGYGYTAIAEKFLIAMLKKGWILHDKIIWVKNNPVFTNSNRCVLSNEFIYVFKKNHFVNYDPSWVKDYLDDFGFITIGDKKLRSVFDFRDNIIITNSVNNSKLRKECELNGFNLTHDATFPISIPSIAIMTSSKPGDLILDPFHGTGTTGRSAQLLGRSYIGYELNPTFIKQSEIRLDMPFESDLNVAA